MNPDCNVDFHFWAGHSDYLGTIPKVCTLANIRYLCFLTTTAQPLFSNRRLPILVGLGDGLNSST